jgi:hypothetical protein
MGAEEVPLDIAVHRIAQVAGAHPMFVPMPIRAIRILAQVTEWLMVVPLVAKAQAFMLAEGVSEPMPWAPEPPEEVRPAGRFTAERIRAAMPEGGFTLRDLRVFAGRR